MPILARESDIYPAELLDRNDLGGQTDLRWWALYTRSRREKELMRRLRSLEIAHCAPLIPHRTRSPSGRTRTSYLPLFSNYVFLYGDEHSRYQALTTNCVSRDLLVPDGPRLTFDLRQIYRLIASGMPLTVESRLEPGRRVRIKSGLLVGQEGIIVQRRGREHLLVTVDFLQQGASVVVEDFEVEAID